MHGGRGAYGILLSALILLPAPLPAQRTAENAVASSADAFGTSVGLESTGIYTDSDTRGFSPSKAGNARMNGIYFDPVSIISGRLRESTAIRVGFSAEDYPFQAPTGIVDYRLKSFPTRPGISFSYNRWPFGGYFRELDIRYPVIDSRLSITAGGALSDLRNTDGSVSRRYGGGIRPILHMANGGEMSFFSHYGLFHRNHPHPLVVTTGDFLPSFPAKRRYLGQRWATSRFRDDQHGITLRSPITDRLSVRGGIFHVIGDRSRNFAEIFTILDTADRARHRLIADPAHANHSTSGEIQFAWRLGGERWAHRFITGYRARNRLTETGGSDVRDFGDVTYGQPERELKPTFTFSRPNKGRVKQSAWQIGYIGKLAGAGTINLGAQKSRYRAVSKDGRTGIVTETRDNGWLYNARLGIDFTPAWSVYVATQRGLEDSGVAPESAANRNEQLRATRSTQYEGGMRWRFDGGQFVLSGFRISKPYFSFDAANRFAPVGQVRHTGVEASLSGSFTDRLNLVVGAVALQPRVSGPARDLGLVGRRPTGTPSLSGKLDLNYRTDIFGGLIATASMTYTGQRAVGARPLPSLGGKQLMVPSALFVDLGVRQRFLIGRTPFSIRAVMFNVFDKETWKVVGPNIMWVEERQRLSVTLAVDL